jgi:hypothetical protein
MPFAHRSGTMCRHTARNDLLNEHTSGRLIEQRLDSTSRKGDSREWMLCNILLPHPQSRRLGTAVAGVAAAGVAVAGVAMAGVAVAGFAAAGGTGGGCGLEWVRELRSPHMCCQSRQS